MKGAYQLICFWPGLNIFISVQHSVFGPQKCATHTLKCFFAFEICGCNSCCHSGWLFQILAKSSFRVKLGL